MRPQQLELLDDTPLALFGGQGQGLTAQDSQPAPVATAAHVRPLDDLPDSPAQRAALEAAYPSAPATMREEIAADVATRTCLQARCGKAAREGSHFCSKTCKAKWTANMAAWHSRLDRTPIDDTNLF